VVAGWAGVFATALGAESLFAYITGRPAYTGFMSSFHPWPDPVWASIYPYLQLLTPAVGVGIFIGILWRNWPRPEGAARA